MLGGCKTCWGGGGGARMKLGGGGGAQISQYPILYYSSMKIILDS